MVLLAVRFVGRFLTARFGDAWNGPPRARPKSLAAAEFRLLRKTLKAVTHKNDFKMREIHAPSFRANPTEISDGRISLAKGMPWQRRAGFTQKTQTSTRLTCSCLHINQSRLSTSGNELWGWREGIDRVVAITRASARRGRKAGCLKGLKGLKGLKWILITRSLHAAEYYCESDESSPLIRGATTRIGYKRFPRRKNPKKHWFSRVCTRSHPSPLLLTPLRGEGTIKGRFD